jgi:transposase-like protein
MNCPHCHSSSTTEREGRTVQGCRRFQCRACGRLYNERTGTVLNRVQVPTDIVFLVVFWRRFRQLSGQAAERRSIGYRELYQAAEIRSRSAATRCTWMVRR